VFPANNERWRPGGSTNDGAEDTGRPLVSYQRVSVSHAMRLAWAAVMGWPVFSKIRVPAC
jgi:hypothetical protein